MVPVRYERLIRIPDDDHPPASKELDVSHSPQKCLRHLWLPHLQKSKTSQILLGGLQYLQSIHKKLKNVTVNLI